MTKYLVIISLTSSISSGATWFYLTKKMDPQLYKQITTIAGVYLNKIKDPNAFCPTGEAQTTQAGQNVQGRGTASDGSVGGVIDENAKLSDLVKQAQEAHKERDRILKENSNNY